MKTAAIALLILLAAPLFAGAYEDAEAIDELRAWRGNESKALELMEKFIADYPGDSRVWEMRRGAVDIALDRKEYERALPHLRRYVERFPDLEWCRDKLCEALRGARLLDDLVAQCDANIKACPESRLASRWAYVHAETLFRLWRFKEAEAELKVIAAGTSDSVIAAEDCLSLINPHWAFDADGIQTGYNGKYLKDVRFQHVLKTFPTTLAAARKTLKDILGVEYPQKNDIYFRFVDVNDGRDGDRGVTQSFCIDYRPATLITFYTEFVVLDPDEFAKRLTHELKHAAFRVLMGQKYLALPDWLKEGLAVHVAGQTDDRVAYLVSTWSLRGADPYTILDGIAESDGRHDGYDYLEDALFFEWLESVKIGHVRNFCQLLIAGEDYKSAIAMLAGVTFEKAIEKAQVFCIGRMNLLIGDSYKQFKAIMADEPRDYWDDRRGDWLRWFQSDGRKTIEEWLKKHPESVLAPQMRFRLGKGLIRIKEYAAGRKVMCMVRDDDKRRSSLADDAQCWIANSYVLEGDENASKREYGVLLRDYSWLGSDECTITFGGYKPAGPVTEEDEKAAEAAKREEK